MSSFLGGGGGASGAPGSILATGNLTFWVATTGSDSNPGTFAQPFATIQHAVNVANQYNYQFLFFPTINVEDGTYNITKSIVLPLLVGVQNSPFVAFNPVIFGDTGTPSLCVIDGGGHSGVTGFNFVGAGAIWQVDGFQLQNMGSGIVLSAPGSLLFVDDIVFSSITNARMNALNTGVIFLGQSNFVMTYTGGGRFLMRAQGESQYSDNGVSNVFTNSQNYTTFVVTVNTGSSMTWPTAAPTNPGNVTGKRYQVLAASELAEDAFSDRSQYLGSTVGTIQPNAGCVILTDPVIYKSGVVNGGTLTLPPGTHLALLVPLNALAGTTVNLPTNMSNGEECEVNTTFNITAMTWGTTDGSSIIGAPAGLAANAAITFVFDTADNAWYCLG